MDKMSKQCSDSAQGGVGVKKSPSYESSIKKASVGVKSDAGGVPQGHSRGKQG